MIFDPGTGMFPLILLLLSAAHGERLLLLLAVPAIVMLRVIQIGGYIPERSSGQAAQTKRAELCSINFHFS